MEYLMLLDRFNLGVRHRHDLQHQSRREMIEQHCSYSCSRPQIDGKTKADRKLDY